MRDPVDYDRGVVDELAPGHPEHAIAARLQFGIATAVALERSPVGVELEAVELDHQAPRRPEQVDLEPGDRLVCLGAGAAVAAQQGEQPALRLRAGQGRVLAAPHQSAKRRRAEPAPIAIEPVGEIGETDPVPSLSVPGRGLELAGVEDGGQVEDGARGDRDRQTVDRGAVAAFEPSRAMYPDPLRAGAQSAAIVTSTLTCPLGPPTSPQRTAADRWLRTAPDPQASTAAISAASLVFATWPTR